MTLTRRVVSDCPVERAVQVLGGRWKSLIVYHLLDAPLRYTALRRSIPQCAERAFVRQLRELEQDGLLERMAAGDGAREVTYRLTPVGAALHHVLIVMRDWGRLYMSADTTRRSA